MNIKNQGSDKTMAPKVLFDPRNRPKKQKTSKRDADLPNMPKIQPCPRCRHRSKRESKSLGGAKYKCPTHGLFFVGHPVLMKYK